VKPRPLAGMIILYHKSPTMTVVGHQLVLGERYGPSCESFTLFGIKPWPCWVDIRVRGMLGKAPLLSFLLRLGA
jgi:hypothetical protein